MLVLANIGWHHRVNSGTIVDQHPGLDTIQDGPVQILWAQLPGENVFIPVFVGRATSRHVIYWAGALGTAGLTPTSGVGVWPPFAPTPPGGLKPSFSAHPAPCLANAIIPGAPGKGAPCIDANGDPLSGS